MVTDEMVEKATAAYMKETGAEQHQLDGWFEKAIRAALEAALSAAEPVAWGNFKSDGTLVGLAEERPDSWTGAKPLYAAPPAPSVAVKALEWNPYSAETPFGWYQIEDQRSVPESVLKGRPPFLLFGSRMDYSRHTTLEAARAAAQADYEARIRSALSAQVQDVAGLESNPETLRWWCQQLLDIIENYDIIHDSCDEEIAMMNDIRASVDPAAPAKQEGGK